MNVSEIQKAKKTITFFWKGGIIVLIGLLCSYSRCYAQTYALSDTSLRNKLIASYPSVMTGNLLNISAAGSLTGVLNLSNSNIRNADGIQFFANISILQLSNNQLENLPDLSGLTQLMAIYLSNNKLVSLPSFTTLTNLVDFQAPYNALTSLPSLASNTNLVSIYCQNNKLTSFPDISTLTNLKILDIGDNNFGQLPDLSTLVNLEQLHVHRTGIDTIIGLSALTKLTHLYAWGNNIRDLSELNSNTTLTLFQVFSNDLTSLPVLSNKPSLTVASLINNRLTFEDILPLSSLTNFSSFSYHPQKPVSLSSYTIREKDSVSFNLSIDPGVTDNVYTWYKNGSILTTNQTGILTISLASYSDSGEYYVQITNPGLSGLTILSDTALLQVKPCMEINSLEKEILSEDCKEGTTLQLLNIQLNGGIGPFNYSIFKTGKTDTLFYSSPQFQSLDPGIYTVVIKDSRMCKAEQIVSVKKPNGCEAFFSPNGDGISDTYFIEESGIARIYDIGRNLVKELTTPAEWDGHKTNGVAADDGYYAIVVNGKKIIHVTLVK